MFLKYTAWILIFTFILPSFSSLKILSVLPFPMKSHHIVFNALLEELVFRGHELVHFSGYPLATNASNYKHINVKTTLDKMFDHFKFEFIKDFIDVKPSSLIHPLAFQQLSPSEETLKLPKIKELIESNNKFDVILLETFFSQEALLGFGHKFNAPVISLSSLGSFSMIDSAMGNPHPVSYIPNMIFRFNCDLTFYERLKNGIKTLSEEVYSYFIHLPRQEAIMKKYFGSEVPPLSKLISNISLVLLNSQPELNYARAFLPNIIQVGGMHVKSTGKSLPREIKIFMDEAKDGVIYFSLGSTFSGSTTPEFFNAAFVRAFSKIKERVLWKIDSPPSNIPKNVMTVKWAPQLDILRHPNCKFFITHGGLLSLLESTYSAVPVIGIPMFADQPMNMAKVEHAGIGIALYVYNITENSVQWALDEVTHNPKYRSNMYQLSAQMRDRLRESPLHTAVHWVEYVAKYQGAPQLRSPARNMSLIQYLLIDVLMFLTATLVISIYLIIVTLKFTCSRLVGSGQKIKSKKH